MKQSCRRMRIFRTRGIRDRHRRWTPFDEHHTSPLRRNAGPAAASSNVAASRLVKRFHRLGRAGSIGRQSSETGTGTRTTRPSLPRRTTRHQDDSTTGLGRDDGKPARCNRRDGGPDGTNGVRHNVKPAIRPRPQETDAGSPGSRCRDDLGMKADKAGSVQIILCSSNPKAIQIGLHKTTPTAIPLNAE